MNPPSSRETLSEAGWDHVYSGKVRDLYVPRGEPAATFMLVVASNRVSAFDHVLEPPIPGKGATLTRITNWWFDFLDVPNHRMQTIPPSAPAIPKEFASSASLVRRLEMFPIECVVRGYLVGSGWLEYQANGSICGIGLPAGLEFGDPLPEPIFTPAYKAALGEHDENISKSIVAELVGYDFAQRLELLSLEIYEKASQKSLEKGLILADTKFEFGLGESDSTLILADEVLTPDSSRYWDRATYEAGVRDQSFDKQIVRNWLAENWLDRSQSPPKLPDSIVQLTVQKYSELAERLIG